MRSDKLFYSLLGIVFLIALSVMPVLSDPEVHQPTLIIPTKYRYLLSDLAVGDSLPPVPVPTTPPVPVSPATPAPTPVPTIEPDQGTSPSPATPVVVAGAETEAEEQARLASLVPSRSYSGFGRGSVSTYFDVNFEEQGRRIDNRERLTARGLFDVHVTHGLN